MALVWREISFLVLALACSLCCADSKPPNILFILADDLGWNDVGFNNPKMITPNIDALASQGVILNQSYVQPICTPSRSALMSGRYPFKIGRQSGVIRPLHPTCLQRDLTILPQTLQQLGYRTTVIGKWHLGFCNEVCTPLKRGFDEFFGKYLGAGDHYYHTRENGYDLRRNESVAWDELGSYSSDVFGSEASRVIKSHDKSKPMFLYLSFQAPHGPFQVDKKYEDMYNIKHTRRRKFCGMVTAMDEAIGKVINAMKTTGLYQNSIIIFSSDNGGAFGSANNWPLRGAKGTLWEGGTRSPSFIHSDLLQKTGYRYDGLTHITDWYPTLVSAAGGTPDMLPRGLDGVDNWKAFQTGSESKRHEMVYNMKNDNLQKAQAAIRIGAYKLIRGNPGSQSGWVKPPEMTNAEDIDIPGPSSHGYDEEPADLSKARLFDLRHDPDERNDLAATEPEIVQRLTARLEEHAQNMVPADLVEPDDKGRPSKWGGVWSPGWC